MKDREVLQGKQKHVCTSCNHKELIQTRMQVVKCPKCEKGLFIDSWHLEQYKKEFGPLHRDVRLDPLFMTELKMNLESLFDHGHITTNMYREALSKIKTIEDIPLLSITLDSYSSIPTVLYKGEEIQKKVKVKFDWETNDEQIKSPNILIEHYEKSDKVPALKTIKYEDPHAIIEESDTND
ncbi:hypothetical protein M3936_16415 [Sutcliffiella horikoshii]|uniref:hypothetical protein n=1 Tax=Sutcliffiella horikoshii TaxID=79883 RepID=UPI00203EBF9C|nr:hypothetical protein [Sutcliffiella horikoshii]MCM3619174.1 hypothetical protein [Sutcliffiella horikoshii]